MASVELSQLIGEAALTRTGRPAYQTGTVRYQPAPRSVITVFEILSLCCLRLARYAREGVKGEDELTCRRSFGPTGTAVSLGWFHDK